MKRSYIKRFFLFIFCISVALLSAQETPTVQKRVYFTKAIDTQPIIDGNLTDKSWNAVEWQTNFIEKRPNENTKPTYQTKFKVAYDAKFLYIAIRSFDNEPNKIESRLTRRDGFAGDRVNIVIDSYFDKRTAFVFTVTAAGVKGDEIATNNGKNIDDSWNPIWYAKAIIDDLGWTAEMKIPLSQLRFGDDKEQVWGLNIIRQLFRGNEHSMWQRIPNNVDGWISNIGELRGLTNLKPQKQLEIQPFTTLQQDIYQKEKGNPFKDGSDFKFNAGIDAKIGITNDLTLDLTINPDFGQVEADPGAISLDGFQMFFNEKRPFFVENKNIFDYKFAGKQDNIFYSRRIGRSPHRSPTLSVGEFAKTPVNTSIVGAAKFSGKTRNGWSIGILESITNNEYAKIQDSNGNKRTEIVEPLTNYFISRIQKDFNNKNTFFGGIFTATNRNLKGNFNELHTSAYTGGLDFEHNWKNRKYFVRSHTVISNVNGSKEAIKATQRELRHNFQRVDASHVSVNTNRTSLTGTGGMIIGGKRSGNWRFFTGFNWRSPELELNDVGFLRQTDEIRQFLKVIRIWQQPTNWYRNAEMSIKQITSFDFEENYNRVQYDFKGEIRWKNNWWTEVELGHKPRIFINAFLRGGPRWRFSEENFATLFFGSNKNKRFYFTLGYVHSIAQQNNFKFRRYVLRTNYQPFSSLNLGFNIEYLNKPNKTQYISTETYKSTPKYILGRIDNQTLSTTIRLNYSINPNLSIQYYAQPFMARGRYTDFNYVANSTAKDLNKRVIWYHPHQISYTNKNYLVDENRDGITDYQFKNPDFSFVQFRSNLVIRWEYIPGSELFFVWSQGATGNDDPTQSLSKSLNNQIFNKELENTFLLKATYRFVL